ncbi:hypothetical protein PEBR_04496 [Penicillium brasilianum]|uniref:Zn(2)-C6 fungal-type domain-containing protein n=1 Tax=Penicillium brasilianum TaxID=104259 RepID=A0A1S9RYI8_PENBI|nr:hypothetical protein PEBR_04496 [Penicillium brasilianum]
MPSVSKTCQRCADSKVRCIRTSENPHVCKRCLRLGRECLYRQTGRRFHGFQKDRKIEALESKVRELMTDQNAVQPSQKTPETAPRTRSASVIESDEGDKDIIDRGLLNIEAAENYLESFKSILTPHFPFVVIPHQVSAVQLREEKPFLFLAIMASASYENILLQRSLGAEVRRAVASRIILNGEVSFDLLQGLLVFLAWSHYYTKPQRYTQFLQLAVSIITDLRLDRPPRTKTWKTKLHFEQQTAADEQTLDRPSWGSDERRAIIGCYYLSSAISVLLQKQAAFSYIPYLEECCQSLQDGKEYPHDQYIAALVQLQHIAEKIDRLSISHRQELMTPDSGSGLYVASLRSDLETFQNRLKFNIHDALQFYTTALSLYQIALTAISPQSGSQLVAHQPDWNEMSCAAIRSSERILNLYLSLPPGTELGFTNTQWVQMAFAMVILYRLTAKSNSTQTAAFLTLLNQLQSRVGALTTPQVDSNGDRDTFFEFTRRVTQIKGLLDKSQTYIDQNRLSIPGAGVNVSVHIPEATEGDPLGLDSLYPEDLLMHVDFSSDFLFEASVEQIMGNWI